MKKITNFKHARIGDWFLFTPLSSNLSKIEGINDKRKTIIIIGNGGSDIHFTNENGEFGKLVWITNNLNELKNLYSDWHFYKLNKKDKEYYNKELILGNL